MVGFRNTSKLLESLPMKRGELVLIHAPTVGYEIDELGIFIEEISIKNVGNYKLSQSHSHMLVRILKQDGSVDLVASFFLKEI